ncbi:unnamed protein product [Rotaria magnacalcarata]
MEKNFANNTTSTTNSTLPTLDFIRNIRQWRERCQKLVNKIADDALENSTSDPTTTETLTETLNNALVEDSNNTKSATVNTGPSDEDTDFGGNDDSFWNGGMPPQTRWPQPRSRQLSISSSISSSAGQAIHIKGTVKNTYACFRDGDNRVMALNGSELVFVDWVRQNDGDGQLKMRVAPINNTIVEANEDESYTDETDQNNFRIVNFPPETQNMRVVDMEYSRWKSAYIIGLNEQSSTGEYSSGIRTSWIYLFDSDDDTFEPWIPLSNPQGNLGFVNRICGCNGKPIMYVAINKFGESGLLVLNEWGVLLSRQYASDLFPDYERLRFIDIACTKNNDLLAIAYNTAIIGSDGLTAMPFTVPRLVWINQLAMFALVNQTNGQLCVINLEGHILGQRLFTLNIEEYDPPTVFPINICAAEKDYVAIRYSRFINIHRVID